MSKIGKICFGFSFLAFFILGAARLIYGGWHDSFWVPFALMFVFFAAGVAKDWRALKEIFMMRTTRHGMNMGVLVITAIAGLACVNFLAARYDKKMDWTREKLNSLSDQSVKAAKALKEETDLVLVYRKEGAEESIPRVVGDLVAMYRDVNDKIKYSPYNGLQRPDLAQKYDFTHGSYVFYAVQGERKVKIDPATEEGITRALLKLGREKKKVVYFTRGHGELLLDDRDATGLSYLKEDLSVTYDVKPLALFETGYKVPEDADVVAIVGPKQQFLQEELEALRDYARRGGRFFIAIDPGHKHNLSLLTKTFGIEFANNFVLDLRSQALRSSPSLVLGTEFSRTSEITQAFRSNGNQIALFELASNLKKDPDTEFEIEQLIKTDETTAAVPELKERIEYRPNGPHVVAMTAKGRLGAKDPKESQSDSNEGKEFYAVVFGDSDFVSNRLILNNSNRDLVGNSFAWLTSDNDLISIRPKEPKATVLNLPSGNYYAMVLSLFMISIVLFASSIGFWWRRRTA